jgi:hypothetical protein
MDCINRHLAAVTTAAKTSVPAIDPRAEYQNSLDAYQACINSNLQNAEACEDKRVQMETNERAYRNRWSAWASRRRETGIHPRIKSEDRLVGIMLFVERIALYRRKDPTNKEPPAETGGSFLRRGALFLLAALSGLLSRLLLLLTWLLLAAALLAATLAAFLVLLVALVLIILGHNYLQIFVKYCLNVIIQPTHFS